MQAAVLADGAQLVEVGVDARADGSTIREMQGRLVGDGGEDLFPDVAELVRDARALELGDDRRGVALADVLVDRHHRHAQQRVPGEHEHPCDHREEGKDKPPILPSPLVPAVKG